MNTQLNYTCTCNQIEDIDIQIQSSEHVLPQTQANSKRGRPQNPFKNLSMRSKRRRVMSLADQYSIAELKEALCLKLNRIGMRNHALVLRKVTSSNKMKIKRLKKVSETPDNKNHHKISAAKALAIYVTDKSSKQKWINLRNLITVSNKKILPSYNAIQKEMEECLPAGMEINETSGKIPLQQILDKTFIRFCQANEGLFTGLSEEDLRGLKCIHKWGLDSASGFSEYQQR